MTLEQLQQKTGAATVLLGKSSYMVGVVFVSKRSLRAYLEISRFHCNYQGSQQRHLHGHQCHRCVSYPRQSRRCQSLVSIAGLLIMDQGHILLKLVANAVWNIVSFDLCGPMYQELPKFLADTKYQDITDNNHCVYQRAFKAEGPIFMYLQAHPEMAANFNAYMCHRRKDMPTWLSVFPIDKEIEGREHDVLFVDVGGNLGHECANLKAKYPNLPGRVVLQDLSHAINIALQTPGVENTVHDIFTPQPIKSMFL